MTITDDMTQLATRIDQTKKAFLAEVIASIIHESNNKLNLIMGPLEDLDEQAQSRSDSSAMEKLAEMRAAIFELSGMLRTFGRICADPGKLRVDLFRALDIHTDVIDFVRKGFKRRDIELRVDQRLNANIRCDRTAIAYLLIELITNALQSASASATETNRWVQITGENSETTVTWTVTNSGPPLSAARQNELFKPFTTEASGTSLGIGLFLAQLNAQAAKGSLTYDPTSNYPRFVLTLPVAPENP